MNTVNINLQHKVGDTVWYMWGNKPQSNKVTSVSIQVIGSFHKDSGQHLGDHTAVLYYVTGWFSHEGGSSNRTEEFDGDALFPTKEALLASL